MYIYVSLFQFCHTSLIWKYQSVNRHLGELLEMKTNYCQLKGYCPVNFVYHVRNCTCFRWIQTAIFLDYLNTWIVDYRSAKWMFSR
uniref:Uncharacterized protein n=1 Tax=Romanomermis culicivorax TaxID=13658 RepID=A0A915KDD1_ROMCU